tara:strand:+ start:496 stop:1188 length:693 start_codon:yes stop_codon:yes gene_type:complete
MNKKTIKNYALDHCIAYTFELAQEQFRLHGEMSFTKATQNKAKKSFEKSWMAEDGHYTTSTDLDYGDVICTMVSKAKTIAECKSLYVKAYRQNVEGDLISIQNLYNAMLCVINYENNVCKDIEYPATDHGGTEDRGWWRVLEAINGGLYFCSFDLGRDMGMAKTFYESGAITETKYRAHIVRRTLKMMANGRFTNDNGLPCYKALTSYLKPEYNELYLDMNLVNTIKEVA